MLTTLDSSLKHDAKRKSPSGRSIALNEALTSKMMSTLESSLKRDVKPPAGRATPLGKALTDSLMATLVSSLKYKPSGGKLAIQNTKTHGKLAQGATQGSRKHPLWIGGEKWDIHSGYPPALKIEAISRPRVASNIQSLWVGGED